MMPLPERAMVTNVTLEADCTAKASTAPTRKATTSERSEADSRFDIQGTSLRECPEVLMKTSPRPSKPRPKRARVACRRRGERSRSPCNNRPVAKSSSKTGIFGSKAARMTRTDEPRLAKLMAGWARRTSMTRAVTSDTSTNTTAFMLCMTEPPRKPMAAAERSFWVARANSTRIR